MSGPDPGFRHSALLYGDRSELLEGLRPFVDAGSARGEALLVAMPSAGLETVAELLEGYAGGTTLMDLDDLGQNPARVISAWQQFAEGEAKEAPGMRYVGECLWFGRNEAEVEECERHEQALNVAFAETPTLEVLCPYDRGKLPEEVVERIGCSHQELAVDGAAATRSETYIGPDEADPLAGVLVETEAEVEQIPFERTELGELRGFVKRHAVSAGLESPRQDDLVLAANELATNSIRYGGGGGTLFIWHEQGRVFCEVRDEGRIVDPMVGRVRPAPDQAGGRGLWLANQLCDLVQIRSGEAGTVVRLAMRA